MHGRHLAWVCVCWALLACGLHNRVCLQLEVIVPNNIYILNTLRGGGFTLGPVKDGATMNVHT